MAVIRKKLLKLRRFSCMIGKVLIEKPFGGVAQLGERYTGSVEVMGSNPTVSTKKRYLCNRCRYLFFSYFFVYLITAYRSPAALLDSPAAS